MKAHKHMSITIEKKSTNKRIELSLEFDSYLVKNPSLNRKIPKGAYLVFTDKDIKKSSDIDFWVSRRTSGAKVIEVRKSERGWMLSQLKAI